MTPHATRPAFSRREILAATGAAAFPWPDTRSAPGSDAPADSRPNAPSSPGSAGRRSWNPKRIPVVGQVDHWQLRQIRSDDGGFDRQDWIQILDFRHRWRELAV